MGTIRLENDPREEHQNENKTNIYHYIFSVGQSEVDGFRIIIIFIIYKVQYPNMLKALYNKIQNYLLYVKTNINNNKYNCKINFQIIKCRNIKLLILKLLIK